VHRPRLLASIALATSLAICWSLPAAADATKIKFVLNWKYQGPQGMFFLAEDRGYFAAEGLDVSFDQGDGAATPIPKVASGAYDMGFGDINALIEFAARKPDEAPVAVYVMFNRPPFAVAVKAASPIRDPKDIAGKRLGGPANDGALKLFPAFCSVANIDCSAITVVNVQPQLREQMLMQGAVDGVFGYINTIRFSAKAMGVDPDSQLRFIPYGDFGMDLYSNAIIASRSLLREHPEAVRGFIRALNKGVRDTIADPDAAVAAVLKREPLLKKDVEKEKLIATMRDEMNHTEVARIGLGAVDMNRLTRAIAIIAAANKSPAVPKADAIFDPSFLPPAADLPKKLF
jgi:NitT/TauT family transport system substrate-binding protein